MKRLALSLLLVGLMAPEALAAKPLTLEAAIQRALETHPDALMAEARTKIAELAIGDAQSQRAQLTTDLSLLNRTSSSQAFGNTPAPSNAQPNQTSYNGTIGLTVPVFTGFKLTNAIASAEHNREAAVAQRTVTRAELTLQVTKAFWTLRKAELIEDVQETAIDQTERTLKLTRTGYQLGRQTISDVDRAEVSVLNAKGTQLQYRESTDQARLQLASLVGVPSSELEIDGEPDLKAALGEPSSDEVDQRLTQRPEIQAAEAKRAAAASSVASARGDLWPQLSAVGTYQLGNNPYNPISGARDAG
ncbi:MAG TPA: TolC family protein, partial [Stenomitos sp.]